MRDLPPYALPLLLAGLILLPVGVLVVRQCGPTDPQVTTAPDPTPTARPIAPLPSTGEEPGHPSGLPAFDPLWNYEDPRGTEVAFRALLDRKNRSLGAPLDGPEPAAHAWWRLELMTQIARAEGLQRKFDEANRTMDQVERALELTKDDPAGGTARVRALLERGRLLNSSGVAEEARHWFERAFTLAQELGLEGLAVDAAHMVAIAHGQTDASLEWGNKALALAEASSDPDARRWRGSLYNNLGWTLHDRGQHEEALALFDKGITARREAGKEPALRVARWARARCLRSLGRHEAALGELEAIVRDYGEAAETDGFVHEELAENMTALKRPDRAAPEFARAHELLKDTWIAKEDPSRLQRMSVLAKGGR